MTRSLRSRCVIVIYGLFCAWSTASAQIIVTPSSLDFGDVGLTATKDDFVELENTSSDTVEISNLSMIGANARPAEFTILSPSIKTFALIPGEKKRVIIRFAPDFDNVRTRRLLITMPTGNIEVPLQGKGFKSNPVLQLSQLSIDFGKISPTGQVSTTLKIVSTGDDDAKISDVTVSNANAFEHFGAILPEAKILKKFDTLEIPISFKGNELEGFKTGDLTLVGDVGGQTRVFLTGEVVKGLLRPDPLVIDFGTVLVGSVRETTVVLNTGSDVPVNVEYIGDPPPGLTYIDPPPLPIPVAPSAPQTLGLRFLPTTPGTFFAEIPLISKDFPFTVFVVRALVRQSPLQLESAPDVAFYCAAQIPVSGTATIRNSGGASIHIKDVRTNEPAVSITSPTDFDVASGASAVVTFAVDPATAPSGPRQVIFEYSDEVSVVLRDTITITPRTAQIPLMQVSANDDQIAVSSEFDVTPLGLTSITVQLGISVPDLFELVEELIELNPTLLPSATKALTETSPGQYLLTIQSSTPIAFASGVPMLDQPLFTYKLQEFLSIDSLASVTVALTSTDPECLEPLAASLQVAAGQTCGDDLLRKVLGNEDLSSIVIYPNPITSKARLIYHAAERGSVRIELRDMKGIVRATWPNVEVFTGSNEILLDVQGLPSGTYLLQTATTDSQDVRHTRLTIAH